MPCRVLDLDIGGNKEGGNCTDRIGCPTRFQLTPVTMRRGPLGVNRYEGNSTSPVPQWSTEMHHTTRNKESIGGGSRFVHPLRVSFAQNPAGPIAPGFVTSHPFLPTLSKIQLSMVLWCKHLEKVADGSGEVLISLIGMWLLAPQ